MASEAEKKEQALTEYRNKLQKHKEIDTKVRALREAVKELKKEYDKTEDDLKALQVCCRLETGRVYSWQQMQEAACTTAWPL
jgi:intracellular sulfur oxidation DsrE/DsrF family protein